MADIDILGRLRSKTVSGELAGADQVKDAAYTLADGTANPTQAQINAELRDKKTFGVLGVKASGNSTWLEIRPQYMVYRDGDGNMTGAQYSAGGITLYGSDVNVDGEKDTPDLVLDYETLAYLLTIVSKMKEGYSVVFEKEG